MGGRRFVCHLPIDAQQVTDPYGRSEKLGLQKHEKVTLFSAASGRTPGVDACFAGRQRTSALVHASFAVVLERVLAISVLEFPFECAPVGVAFFCDRALSWCSKGSNLSASCSSMHTLHRWNSCLSSVQLVPETGVCLRRTSKLAQKEKTRRSDRAKLMTFQPSIMGNFWDFNKENLVGNGGGIVVW